ncbi:DNA topoisomerase VI subunit B [bacterium]|nr:DNA topoisomerase VI subunit B [bacterium]MBU1917837.1 DNA topoisomerase VI subunit B [bacterium]
MAVDRNITKSSSAEYFSKNLQQVGFSSYTKATLTTVKEAIDNSLDACEDWGILPEISVVVERLGVGGAKGADLIKVTITDNGPGLTLDDAVNVFGQYLASSKFGRGRCSRGQQGIGISAVTTWSQLTHGTGAVVITKTQKMKQAIKAEIIVDIKKNKGAIKNKESIDWDRETGVSCEFVMDARVQLNGDAGLITYLQGTALVNPHLTIRHKLLDNEEVVIERVTDFVPKIPERTSPHPHTMKLGEFLAHSHLFGKTTVRKWLKDGFSRVSEHVIGEMVKQGTPASWFGKALSTLKEDELKQIYAALQTVKLMAPPTKSVMSIGESDLAKSIQRLGEIDFFSVMSRKPTICDFKPVQVEVAIARLKEKTSDVKEGPVQVLRFANRVPLQFDKAACAMSKAIESVNWRPYGLIQPKKSLPQGPYIFAVSVVSPFIKFKNASKETVDASDELVDEIRRTLQQCGQRLSAHIKRETKAADVERKLQHIEQFAPILVDGLCRITNANKGRKAKAMEGLDKILGRDTKEAEKEFKQAHNKSKDVTKKMAEKLDICHDKLHDKMHGIPESEPEKGQLDLLD